MKKEEHDNLDQTIQQINNQVFITDLFHMMYLKPIQCVLDQNKGGLPKGLKIVQRKSQTVYQLKSIQPILSYRQFNKLDQNKKIQLCKINQQPSRQTRKEKPKLPPIKQKNGKYGQPIRQFQIQKQKQKQPQKKKVFPTYLKYIKQNHGDNLLCQMKAQGAIEIAICICMYNEDRGMLNNTLLGVGENIINLYNEGIDPDKIVVMVVQDGIQKMDSSILQLLEVMQNQSGMRFGVDKQKNLQQSLKRISKMQTQRKNYGWEGQDNVINLNQFLFTKQQQEQRNRMRFINVKKQYDQISKLLKDVDNLIKRKNITHEDLPPKVLTFFKLQCKRLITGDVQEDALPINKQKQQQNLNKYFEQVSVDLNRSKPLIQNALTKTRQFCKQYINSRSEMSHISFFRTSQFFPDQSGVSTQELQEISILRSRTRIQTINSQQTIPINNSGLSLKQIQDRFAVKMNLFFVVKYKNAQKLSSHNWFFNGFCKEFSNAQIETVGNDKNGRKKTKTLIKQISPKYTVLLDVGLRPQASALCIMYNTMINHDKIGGVCGYMGLKIQRQQPSADQMKSKLDFFTRIFLNFVDIQRAQQLQYNFAHLIDKGFQSIFKFIHVLPGAFSGYNMNAIWGKDPQKTDKLLGDYFKSIGQKVKDQKYSEDSLGTIRILLRVLLPNFLLKLFQYTKVKDKSVQKLMYQSNVYLAEDRILCMGIHKNQFNLMFLPDAYSFVDPVKDIPALMGQRKRWINGSFFAFQKVADQFSEGGFCQIINLQLWYLGLMNTLAYTAPGFFLFSISVAMQAFKADVLVNFFADSIPKQSDIYNAFVYTVNFIYALIIFGLIYFSMSLTNRNQMFIRFVYGVSTVLGLMSVIMLVILVVDLARGLGRGNSYLIANQQPTFVQDIPGGQSTIDIIRYIVLGIMGLYAVPLLLYSILFCNIRIIFQVIAGAISFAFYTPTYLIILNVYALCRMDDLSWGTKGLDAGSGKDASIENYWKVIKTIHVGKLVFWNVIVAGLLIHFGSNYLVRFWLTLALMIIIAVTMAIKVILAVMYYICYKCCIQTKSMKLKEHRNAHKHEANYKQKIQVIPSLYRDFRTQDSQGVVKSELQKQLRKQIKNNVITLTQQSGMKNNDINIASLQMYSYLLIPGKKAANNQMGTAVSRVVSNVLMSGMYKNKLAQNRAKRQNTVPYRNNHLSPIHNMQNSGSEASFSPQKSFLKTNGSVQQSQGFFQKIVQKGTDLFTGGNKTKKNMDSFKNKDINIKKI